MNLILIRGQNSRGTRFLARNVSKNTGHSQKFIYLVRRKKLKLFKNRLHVAWNHRVTKNTGLISHRKQRPFLTSGRVSQNRNRPVFFASKIRGDVDSRHGPVAKQCANFWPRNEFSMTRVACWRNDAFSTDLISTVWQHVMDWIDRQIKRIQWHARLVGWYNLSKLFALSGDSCVIIITIYSRCW